MGHGSSQLKVTHLLVPPVLGARETDAEQIASPRSHVTYWLLQFHQNAHNAPSTWTSHLVSCSSRTGSPTRKHGGFQVKTNKNTYRLHALHLLIPLERHDGSGCICSRGPFCSIWNPPSALGLLVSQWFRVWEVAQILFQLQGKVIPE